MDSWIPDFLEWSGYWGVALLMFVENIFPPIPSEVVMPYAGFVASQGELKPHWVVVAGTAGSVLGALPWYALGYLYSHERLRDLADRHGVWLTMDGTDVDRAMDWFSRHGQWAILGGRLVPGVRTLISVPAGLSRMSMPLFLLFTTIGTAAWTAALAYAGVMLGKQWKAVGTYLGPVANVIVVGIVLWYLVRVGQQLWRRRGERTSG